MGFFYSFLFPWNLILPAIAIIHFIRRRPDSYWLWIILIGGGLGKLQQLSESRRAGLMHSGAKSHLDCFQIQSAAVRPLGEDAAQQCGYFARALLVDRFGRFFSSAVSVSSMGR